MRAAVWDGTTAPLTIREVALRRPGPLDTVVRITASCACISDVIVFNTGRPLAGTPVPQIPGHGAAGVVEWVGEAVRRVAVGDRVVVAANPYCAACYACLRDRPDQCSEIVIVGSPHTLVDDGGPVHPNSAIGGYAEQSVVPERLLTPVRTDASDDALSLLADGVGGGLGGAFNVAPVTPGSTVAVLGCGLTGLGYVQAARINGAERIFAVDPRPDRRAIAVQLGATHEFDPTDDDAVERIKDEAGGFPGFGDRRGVEFTFEASADHRAIEFAWQITRPTGHIVLASMPMDLEATVTFSALDLAMTGKQIHGCQWGVIKVLRDLPRYVHLIDRGELLVEPMVTRRYTLDDINDAFVAVSAYDVVGAVVHPND